MAILVYADSHAGLVKLQEYSRLQRANDKVLETVPFWNFFEVGASFITRRRRSSVIGVRCRRG